MVCLNREGYSKAGLPLPDRIPRKPYLEKRILMDNPMYLLVAESTVNEPYCPNVRVGICPLSQLFEGIEEANSIKAKK